MNCDDGTLLGAVAALLFAINAEYVRALTDAVFFCSVREYLIDDMLIGTYRDAAAARLATALGMLSTTIVTLWVLYQGFMVISGTNRQPMMGLLYKTGKLVFILSLVSLVAGNSPAIADTVLDFQRLITVAIVGEDTNVYRMIDLNLGLTQIINQIINNISVGREAGSTGNGITTAAGLLGQSGPAMITTVLALLAEIAITFAILLAPLFIFFLLFQQTSSLFWSWAKFLLGTFVSLAALAVVSSIALRISAVYGASVLAAYYANASNALPISFDISSSAMRMATLGTLLSAIIISIPPMIMQFFNAGVGFATGAMGGMMGGAAAGRMAGGGTGVPGFGHLGGSAGGAGGGASGSSNGAYLPAPPRARDTESGAGGSEGGARQIALAQGLRVSSEAGSSTVLAPGARGLAAPESATLAELQRIGRYQSESGEFGGNNDYYLPPPGSNIGRGGGLPVSGAIPAGAAGARGSYGGGDGTGGFGGVSGSAAAPTSLAFSNGNVNNAASSHSSSSTSTNALPPPGASSADLYDLFKSPHKQEHERS